MPISDWTKTNTTTTKTSSASSKISDWATTKPQPVLNKFGMDVSGHPTNPLNKNNQFVDPNTPFPKFNIFKDVKGSDFVSAAKTVLPGTSKTVGELKSDPLSLKSNYTSTLKTNALDYIQGKKTLPQLASSIIQPKQTISEAWNTIKDSVKQEAGNIKKLFETIKLGSNSSKADRVSANLKVITGGANVLFSPVTALFNRANELPILGSVSRVITLPFQALGEGGAGMGNIVVDKLPIPQEAKDKIKPAVQEIFALAAQIALGKTGWDHKAYVGLKEKFGPEDTKTIIDQAIKLADEKKNEPFPTDFGQANDPHGILSEFDKKILTDFSQQKPPLQLEAPIETKQLELPPGKDAIYGKGFTMTDKPDKSKVAIGKAKYEATQAFIDAVSRFNKNPIPSNLTRLQKLRETLKSLDTPMEVNSAKSDVAKKNVAELVQIQKKEIIVPGKNTKINQSPKIISGKLPTETKVSGVAKSIEAKAIEQNLTKQFEDVAGYEPKTVKDQAAKVAEIITSDSGKARKILTGEEQLPAGVSGSMFIKGMEEHAIKNSDVSLLRDLASSSLVSDTSIHAQELRFLAERDPTGAVAAMKDIAKTRSENLKVKDVPKEKAATVEQIKGAIKKTATKETWSDFVQSIKC